MPASPSPTPTPSAASAPARSRQPQADAPAGALDLQRLSEPTEEHRLLRELVRDLVAREVDDQATAHDRTGTLNVALLRRLGGLGLLGLTVPTSHGGGGSDAVGALIAHHELAKADPGFTLAYLAHAILFVNNLFHSADDEQRARYLPRAISGEWIGAMGMTEPGARTDVFGMQTTATRRGNAYVLRGRKTFITNAPDAYCFLVYAKVAGRITTFVVDRTCEGFSTGPHIGKMGMRAAPMAELLFDDCVVPARNRVGEEGAGTTHMVRNLEIERLCLAAISLGIADRCVETMLRYSVERTAFGKPLADFGQIQRYIAESYAKTEAARSPPPARRRATSTRRCASCTAASPRATPVAGPSSRAAPPSSSAGSRWREAVASTRSPMRSGNALLHALVGAGATRLAAQGFEDGRLDGGTGAAVAARDGGGTTRVLLVNRGPSLRMARVDLDGAPRRPATIRVLDDPATPPRVLAPAGPRVAVPPRSLVLVDLGG